MGFRKQALILYLVEFFFYVTFWILSGLPNLKSFFYNEVKNYAYETCVIDLAIFALIRIIFLLGIYMNGLSRPLWPSILMSTITSFLSISKGVYFFRKSPVNYFFKDLIIILNFIFGFYETYLIYLANKKTKEEEDKSINTPSEEIIDDFERIDRGTLAESFNKNRISQNLIQGFHESYCLKAHSPNSEYALWINYYLFRPGKTLKTPYAEIITILYNSKLNEHIVVRKTFSVNQVTFSNTKFDIKIGKSRMSSNGAIGNIKGEGFSFHSDQETDPLLINGYNEQVENEINWDLSFSSFENPLRLFEKEFYYKDKPKHFKMIHVCPSPFCLFGGAISSQKFGDLEVDGWTGSQTHSWGNSYPKNRIYATVYGFDSRPRNCIEVLSDVVNVGLFKRRIFIMVLRYQDKEIRLNSLYRGSKAKSTVEYTEMFDWVFQTQSSQLTFQGTISAPRDSFITLPVRNENLIVRELLISTKASFTLRITEKKSGKVDVLKSENKCFFEIITNDYNQSKYDI
ncbi:steroidogenic acute regulatory protein-like [Anaeramoeba flamelloides]|uniref:Steroidogenic acute regulatory protein-like n=1 Tax=Anaeramoeba flamelloides TaxID=1746091 RepID=A0AAV7ZY83_9EUKA|nr:steroidogenic acute regulatory protein-like [Anaeramoeba flamelloides]KAJ6251541.1 steroidogenic acute regulatory protein-like [Anaeramoeba flamelloides]